MITSKQEQTNMTESTNIHGLLLSMNQKLESIDARFNSIDARFNEIDASIDARFNEIDASIDARFNEVDARFNKVDARFNEVDARFNEITGSLSELKGAMFETAIRKFVRRNHGVSFGKEMTVRSLWQLVKFVVKNVEGSAGMETVLRHCAEVEDMVLREFMDEEAEFADALFRRAMKMLRTKGYEEEDLPKTPEEALNLREQFTKMIKFSRLTTDHFELYDLWVRYITWKGSRQKETKFSSCDGFGLPALIWCTRKHIELYQDEHTKFTTNQFLKCQLQFDVRGKIVKAEDHATVEAGEIKSTKAGVARRQLLIRLFLLEKVLLSIYPEVSTVVKIGRIWMNNNYESQRSDISPSGVSFFEHRINVASL
eukprot:TRINITY_DN979_c0_g2_i4.p1 TRINITY_DN979_c0_g2~~TRINITY_DN979_c0_g2_i4.p1  ORF type:complete len:370 (+),score=48.43 TRINITY_DN979_c0_g2_i4:289-1398(+)